MKKKSISIFSVIVLLIGFCIVFSIARRPEQSDDNTRYEQHEVKMAEGADPSLGITGFKDGDYSVDPDFVSHLPLVVIDLEGNKIPDAYAFDKSSGRFVLKEGVDPYVGGKISVIDNASNVNTLSDQPSEESDIQIKYRGNSSVIYNKHQFRIKLQNQDGENNPLDIMGMGADSDWILNISMIDASLVRNYMAMNIAGQIMPYVPDVRYCEVIMKDGDHYVYQGLYLMMESVKAGDNRVDISKYKSKHNYTSYLVRRDRYDEEDTMLNTYATQNKLCYGYLALRYPSGDDVNAKVINYVTDDISKTEKVLFSNYKNEFMKYKQYIDEDSFVDYFLINEYFANYDAGNNSTYMYKDVGGKLTIGPVWDYDNDLDNIGKYMLDPETISFEGQAWFPQLLQSESFCKKLISRYQELRKTVLSDEYINNYVDQVSAYLGNAQKRDWSRWNDEYTKERFDVLEDKDGIPVDRNLTTFDENTQKVKDICNEHAEYILPQLQKLLSECKYKAAYNTYTEYGIAFIVLLLSVIVIVRRRGEMKG